ncbi:hypothetical protein Tco_0911738 [Tanacetum coccineum]|uniref:Uncharacterized protein n=1 Tax=Tanacetum coccineum TaxID=301880 RepID=A0ABQ5CXM4_9ASTR
MGAKRKILILQPWEAAKTLSKVASQNVSTYKRRARSASKGKDIGIGMDFFSAAKERCNSAEVEVNTEVNPGSAGVNTGNTPVSTCNTPKISRSGNSLDEILSV